MEVVCWKNILCFYGQFKTSLKVRRPCLVVWQLPATQGSLVMLVALIHNVSVWYKHLWVSTVNVTCNLQSWEHLAMSEEPTCEAKPMLVDLKQVLSWWKFCGTSRELFSGVPLKLNCTEAKHPWSDEGRKLSLHPYSKMSATQGISANEHNRHLTFWGSSFREAFLEIVSKILIWTLLSAASLDPSFPAASPCLLWQADLRTA